MVNRRVRGEAEEETELAAQHYARIILMGAALLRRRLYQYLKALSTTHAHISHAHTRTSHMRTRARAHGNVGKNLRYVCFK